MSQSTITSGQIRKIHALKGALALDDDVYREVLAVGFGVRSSKELSLHQAKGLIEHLESKAVAAGMWERRGEKPSCTPKYCSGQGKKYDDLGQRNGDMATPKQLRLIDALWSEASRAETAEERKKALRHFITRIAKISDIRFLDMAGAQKVINGLNAMTKNNQGGCYE